MSERLLCSNLILPPGDTSVTERLHNCGVPGWSLHIQFLLHSQTKRGADLLSSIVHFKDSGTDEEIMLLTCVSLDIYLQTLKQRHSIRIWSWEIWWRLKWIDTLGVQWWLSAKDNQCVFFGTSRLSSRELFYYHVYTRYAFLKFPLLFYQLYLYIFAVFLGYQW